MKSLLEYLKEQNMYYRHVLTYNFSNDDTRASFKELVEGLGYIEAEDQSTYVMPYSSSLKSTQITDAIKKWSEGKDVIISSDDFVQLFYLLLVSDSEKKVTKISSRFLKYDAKSKGLK